MNRRAAWKVWHLPVYWAACDDEQQAIEPTPVVVVQYVYVPYGTQLPPGARQALSPATTPPAITAGATEGK